MRMWMLARVACGALLYAGCGGGGGSPSPTPDSGANPDLGMGTNPDVGSSNPDVGSNPDVCPSLPCLQQVQTLMFSCQATASCVSQIQASGTAACYDNGVKILVTQSVSGTSNNQMVQVKNGATLCYTRTFDVEMANGGSDYTTDVTTKNASGTVLLTSHQDANGVITVTCPGGQPTMFTNGDCSTNAVIVTGAYVSTSTTLPDCTDGTCTF